MRAIVPCDRPDCSFALDLLSPGLAVPSDHRGLILDRHRYDRIMAAKERLRLLTGIISHVFGDDRQPERICPQSLSLRAEEPVEIGLGELWMLGPFDHPHDEWHRDGAFARDYDLDRSVVFPLHLVTAAIGM